MMRSLYSGVSGLKTHQTKMDVIGNNIANVNTVGFKSSTVTFSDIMYQTVSGASGSTSTTGGKNAQQIGLGVSTAATKVSITSAGASQSTGEAFDIKLTDSNSTNFFIVNTGTENVFTRAGSFYIDGNGNLAMTSTGYLVMGWQVSPTTGEIVKDTVSALRIMQASNLTSAPEATTNATISGVLDKNDTNVTSDDGYYRTLTFYDNLGYSYTAKFSFKAVDTDAGSYTVELVNLYDSNGVDVLESYEGDLSDVFGVVTDVTNTYDSTGLTYAYDSTLGTIGFVDDDGNTEYCGINDLYNDDDGNGYYWMTSDGTKYYVKNYFSLSDSDLDNATLSINSDGQLEVTAQSTLYSLQFNTDDGTFTSINGNVNGLVTLTLSSLGGNFEDIEMDFSQMLNQNNSGSSTVEVAKGASDGTTGVGKKLGTLTGVSIDSSGCIYGSYDNGNTVLLGQIAVAQFANASGLESLGNNCYATTLNSGEFDGIGVDITADGGSMQTGYLEMSNVDLSTEFTDMIVTQRGFQANSRIITVSDTMLEELINLKR